MHSRRPPPTENERRKFLTSVIAVSGATALGTVSAGLTMQDDVSDSARNKKNLPSKGYHLTPHIQAYYNTLNE